MFARRHRKIVSGESYEYWTLCESRRTAAGPRQRVVATLGKLTGEEPLEEAGWEQLDALLEGRPCAPSTTRPPRGSKPTSSCGCCGVPAAPFGLLLRRRLSRSARLLALAMWRTLEMWMRGKGLGTCARRLVEEIATIKSMDVVLPVRRGDTVAQLRLRCVSRPERRVAELLVPLGLELPTRSRILEDFPVEGSQNAVQKNTP